MQNRACRAFAFALCLWLTMVAAVPPRFEISIVRSASANPITDRLILIISKREQSEPRLTVSPQGPGRFAVDLDQLRPEQSVTIDENALGYPMPLAAAPGENTSAWNS